MVLLPIIAGILMWDKLPNEIPTHWNINGEVDGYAGKGLALLGLPFFLLAVHVLCIFATVADPKGRNIGKGPFTLVLFICPIMSIVITYLEITFALGNEIDVSRAMMIMISVLFLFIGNYLPKSRRNYTMGIKTPWSLNSDDNWNATHRFGGYVFILIGVLGIVIALFLKKALPLYLIIMITASFLPMIYSFIYYLKNEKKED